jgi:hypothetical protein
MPPWRGARPYHEHGLAENSQDRNLARREIHTAEKWQEGVPHPHRVEYEAIMGDAEIGATPLGGDVRAGVERRRVVAEVVAGE